MKIPKYYQAFFNQREIYKSLKTKSLNEAQKMCKILSGETEKLFSTLSLGLLDSEQIKIVVDNFLQQVLHKKNTHQFIPQESDYKKEETVNRGKSIGEIVELYLKNIPHTTSQTQKKSYKSFFENILLGIIDKNTLIKEIDREKLLELRETFQALPKRNIQKYRDRTVSQMLSMKIKEKDLIGLKTVNDYVKWSSSLFSFALKYGYIDFNPATDLQFKLKNNAKESRDIFEDDELKKITSLNDDEDIKLFHYTLFYTGMINSEFLQAKISNIDGVLCFDLTDSNLKLKTLSRYRIIPVHSHLLELGIIEKLKRLQSYSSDYLSKRTSSFIKTHISTSSTKVGYSFRHTFATKLQNNMVEENIIAQLMGHANSGMTFGRYAKGYVASNLKNSIETLHYPS
jgi:integrase